MSKSTQGEYIDGGIETEMMYRPLSCENVLFAAWAYKRNYRNKKITRPVQLKTSSNGLDLRDHQTPFHDSVPLNLSALGGQIAMLLEEVHSESSVFPENVLRDGLHRQKFAKLHIKSTQKQGTPEFDVE